MFRFLPSTIVLRGSYAIFNLIHDIEHISKWKSVNEIFMESCTMGDRVQYEKYYRVCTKGHIVEISSVGNLHDLALIYPKGT